ncbi:MAG: (d)CMP kinase [Alphaproteobacteria bacterium]|nr:(d)CMP kinase [Alphaproteobacteria bacterium]
MIIAVDGTAASGKGTLAKRLADHFHLAHLDTGGLYRAVALRVLRLPFPADEALTHAASEASQLTHDDLNHADLRLETTSAMASRVASIPAVRQALLAYQQDFAANPPNHASGAVLDGRDIGTIILPNADIKFYCDAEIEIRAQRRHKELISRGETATYADILAGIAARDNRDMNRPVAPLKPAEDAIRINTGKYAIDQMVEQAMTYIVSPE